MDSLLDAMKKASVNLITKELSNVEIYKKKRTKRSGHKTKMALNKSFLDLEFSP